MRSFNFLGKHLGICFSRFGDCLKSKAINSNWLMVLLFMGLLQAGHSMAADWAMAINSAGVTVGSSTVDVSGNSYITGHLRGASLALGNVRLNRINATGGGDIFVAKLDASGNTVWAKNFGGASGGASGYAIAVDKNGYVYVTGELGGDLSTPVLKALSSTNTDAFILKLDAAGNVVWAKAYGGGEAGVFSYDIAVDGSSNVYLGGVFTAGNMTTPALTKVGVQDGFIFKLDAAGNMVWAQSYGAPGALSAVSGVSVDANGLVYLAGYFGGKLITPALASIGTSDAFVFKLNGNGGVLWAKNFGGVGSSAHGDAIDVDARGNVYLGAMFSGANLTAPSLARIGDQDALAVKLDASGNTVWAKNYGGSTAWVSSNGIAVDGSGNVYMAGITDTNLTSPALTMRGTLDAYIVKLDASGNMTWANNYGGKGASLYPGTVDADEAGNVYLSASFTGGSLSTPALTGNGFILKISSTSTPGSGAGATIGLYEVTNTAVTAIIQPNSVEIGTRANIWIAAIYNGALYIREGDIWKSYSSGDLPVAMNGVTLSASTPVTVLSGIDVSQLAGLKLYVGFGSNQNDMLTSPGKLAQVYPGTPTVPGQR